MAYPHLTSILQPLTSPLPLRLNMRVVHIVESFGGGVIGFVTQLCRFLPQHEHIVLHAVRAGEVDPALTQSRFPEGVQFVQWAHAVREISPLADAKAFASLYRIMRQYRGSMFHLHSSKAGFLGRLAARMLGIKQVLYTPGGAAFVRQDITATKRSLYGRLEHLANKFAGRVVACSHSEAEAFAAIGVNALVIPNGTEILNQHPPPHPFIERALVVTTGRTTVQKNPALFNAIAAALVNDSRFAFRWVGAGEMDDMMSSPNVELTGWQTADQVRGHLAGAHIYLSTAIWEGLSLSALEAMEAGLPLLMSNCPGNTDVVEQGRNGYIYNTAAEAVAYLKEMVLNLPMLEQMGRYSHLMVRRDHDLQKVADQYEHLYLQCQHTQPQPA